MADYFSQFNVLEDVLGSQDPWTYSVTDENDSPLDPRLQAMISSFLPNDAEPVTLNPPDVATMNVFTSDTGLLGSHYIKFHATYTDTFDNPSYS